MKREEKIRQLDPEIQGELGDALDRLKSLGATGTVHLRGFGFKVQEHIELKESLVFSSEFVSHFGKEEGLSENTPIVTLDGFMRYIDYTYPTSTDQALEQIVNSTYPGLNFNSQAEAAKQGLSWIIHYTPTRGETKGIGVNPEAVLAVLGRYNKPEDIPRSISRGSLTATVWHGFARHLKETTKTIEK